MNFFSYFCYSYIWSLSPSTWRLCFVGVFLYTYIKVMFKVMSKMAKKKRPNFFFDPPKNKKPSVQKVPPYGIYGDI